MANKIEINLSVLESTITIYTSSVDRLNSNMSILKNSVTTLRNGWEGQAELAFFENHYPKWEKQMNNQIKHLEFLTKQLNIVYDEFKEIEVKSKQVKLDF